MTAPMQAPPIRAGASTKPIGPAVAPDRRRRAKVATAVISLVSLSLLVDLLLVNHTTGEEVWGPITAGAAALTSALSLAYITHRGRSRVARFALYALWGMVAFFGFGGYNDHRLPRAADTISDQRQRPPLAPLAFTGLGIAGAAFLRHSSKES
jgi:hypothetical protein